MASTLETSFKDGIFTVDLARPEVRNAFNDRLIADLQKTFDGIARDQAIRVVVLRGRGPVFCAGGDLDWMQKSIKLSKKENLGDTTKLAKMFATLNACSKPVVGLIHGAAIGGGVGLVSICDYAACTMETKFSLSEVRLGIIPACIGPFVLAKIGESQARAYFMSAERFSGLRAYEIGLVHEVVEKTEDLEKVGQRVTANLLQCGPNAMAAAKAMIRGLKAMEFKRSLGFVAKVLADLRVSPEGQEGLKAFLEKRPPKWVKP